MPALGTWKDRTSKQTNKTTSSYMLLKVTGKDTNWTDRMGKDSTEIETKSKQEYLYSYQIKQTLSGKPVKRDKEGHHLVKQGSIHQEDITIINIYEQNTK